MARIEDLGNNVGIGGPVDYAPSRPNQAFNQLGQEAAAADNLLEEIQNRDATLQGASALADYHVAREKRQVELRTQAKTPDGFVETAMADFDEQAEKFIAGHENPRVQAYLEQRLVEARTREETESIGWQANAMQARAEQHSLDIVQKYANMVTSSPGKFTSALAEVEAAIDAAGLQLPGADRMRASAREVLSRSAVYGQVETNPHGVLKQLSDGVWDAYLDPNAKISAINAAQSEIKRREGEARANAAQARAENYEDASQLVQSDLASRAVTGKGVDDPSALAKIKAGLTSKQFEKYQAAATKADVMFKATGDMRTMPTAELTATVERLKPQGGEADFAIRQDAYVQAGKLAESIVKEREADPGAVVRENFTKVRSAWQIAEKSGHEANLRDAVKASQAAQRALGIPEAEQKLIPEGMAANIAGQLANANAQEASKALLSHAARFGPHWKQVYRQISPKLDPAIKLAATLKDVNAATLMIDTSRQPKAKVRTAAGVGDKDISDMIAADSLFTDFRDAMGPYGVNNNSTIDTADATETQALGYMITRGMTKEAAVNAALKDTLGHYRYGSINGRTFATPESVETRKAEAGARVILKNLDASKYDFAHSGVSGSLEADERKAYQAGLRSQGFFVSSPGLAGLTLYGPRGAVTRYGKPVTYTWDEINSGAAKDQSSDGVGYTRIPGVN